VAALELLVLLLLLLLLFAPRISTVGGSARALSALTPRCCGSAVAVTFGGTAVDGDGETDAAVSRRPRSPSLTQLLPIACTVTKSRWSVPTNVTPSGCCSCTAVTSLREAKACPIDGGGVSRPCWAAADVER
jgi:hypothetical protein